MPQSGRSSLTKAGLAANSVCYTIVTLTRPYQAGGPIFFLNSAS